jgi:uncharacterized protein GlcG (DUF336 family)
MIGKARRVLLGAAVLFATLGAAASADAQGVITTKRLPVELATEAALEAISACAEQGYAVSASVVDNDAIRIAVLRGDGATVHTIEFAWGKAYGAISIATILKVDSTGTALEKLHPPGEAPFVGPPGMVMRPGGITISAGDDVIAAIGVSGAPSTAADEACARAGVAKIAPRLRRAALLDGLGERGRGPSSQIRWAKKEAAGRGGVCSGSAASSLRYV